MGRTGCSVMMSTRPCCSTVAIAGLDREALRCLDAKPPQNISDGSGFRFAYRFEEDPALCVDEANGCFEMPRIEPHPVVLIKVALSRCPSRRALRCPGVVRDVRQADRSGPNQKSYFCPDRPSRLSKLERCSAKGDQCRRQSDLDWFTSVVSGSYVARHRRQFAR